jgi:hypothetical protein
MIKISQCSNCGKSLYFGPRIKTRTVKRSGRDKIWRHVDTEHRKCAGRMPVATPV